MNASSLKNSILQLALQGKLVKQIEEEGSAKELLKMIEVKKIAINKNKKSKESIPLENQVLPFDIPENWEWTQLSDIIQIINGDRGKNYPSKQTLSDHGIPFISALNIEGNSISEDKLLYMSEEQYNKLGNGKLLKGDIVLCIRGSLGKNGRYPFNKGAIASSLVIIRSYLNEEILYKYISYYINSGVFSNEISKYNNGTAQPNLAARDLAKFLLPLPPLSEQKRIVDKIEELFFKIDSYDNHYLALEALNKRFPKDLEKSILQYAIEGKLVEQDTSDEPAAKLLKQISEQKEQMIKEKVIKKEKSLPSITEEEIPFDIPENWAWMRLGNIFNVNPRNTVDNNLSVSFMPMSLLDEGYRNSFTFEIRKWQDVKKGYTHFRNGDLLIAKITPCFQNLKSAIASDLENGFGAGTTELHVLRPYIDLHLPYFLWFVKSPSFVADCVKNMSGTAGQQRVGKSYIQNYLVPVPPLEEQIRIANKIEQFLKSTNLLKN